ncbi:MAG TPA: helix-turn-helix transcriptional regulator [Vicinamibacterales bacterium]|jgi:transcriptional regulator with XRE-family HTH domain
MSGREAFGPNLRRLRIQRGVSLQQIATETNVSDVLWAAMERNDFSRWPNGIFARAYMRDYAKIIGADPDTTVDEFCRWFPQGDRRADKQMTEHAEILNHTLDVGNQVPEGVGEDRRWSPEKAEKEAAQRTSAPAQARQAGVFGRLRRAFGRA